jgi:hypothetical protein
MSVMSDPHNHPRGTRQLSALAANGGFVLYALVAIGLVLAAGVLAALRLFQVIG